MPQQFDLLINTYLDSKVGVAPRFLTKALSQGLQQNMQFMKKEVFINAIKINLKVTITVNIH